MKYVELIANGKGNGQYLPISSFYLSPGQQVMIIGADIQEIGDAILLQDGPDSKSVPSGKLSEQNAVMRTNLIAFLVNDGFPFHECLDPAVVIVTRMQTTNTTPPKFDRPGNKPKTNKLPLYQAVNTYFVEWFEAHPKENQAVIPNVETLKTNLRTRFKVSYTIRAIRKLVDADCYLVPGEGYGFKRSDFYIPLDN